MTNVIDPETLMRYLDGELPPGDRERVETTLSDSTETRREMELFRAMKEDLAGLSFSPTPRSDSVWSRVNRKLARPLGWTLVVAGAAVWVAYGSWIYITSPVEPWEKLATGAIVIGMLVLLATVIAEQYRAYSTDPYRDVQR